MTDCSRGPTARRVWHVDPLNKRQDPVLRELGLIVSNYAYQKPATLHFEPWLKHMCSVYLQEGDETHAVASSGGRYYPVTDDLREDVEIREVWSDPCLLQSAFQPLIREICGIGLEVDGVAREGSGALSVRGHKFSLIANISPSPWGEHVAVHVNREGDVLPDPFSVFPWIECGLLEWHVFGRLATDEVAGIFSIAQRITTNYLARTKATARQCVQWARRLVLQRAVPPLPQRVELLGDPRYNDKNTARSILFGRLRDATGIGYRHVRLVVNRDIMCYQQGLGDTHWRRAAIPPQSCDAACLSRVIADLGSRYPVEVAAEDGAVGIAFSVGGHPLDVTIKELRVQDVSWGDLTSDIAEGISPTATVLDITIHDDSPDPPALPDSARLDEEWKEALGKVVWPDWVRVHYGADG